MNTIRMTRIILMTHLLFRQKIIYALDIIYIVDIVMVIGCKLMPSFDLNEVDLVLRPTWIIVLEIISLIPFEFCVPRTTPNGKRIFCIIKLTKVLRFARILYFYVRHRNLIGSKTFVRIVAMLSMEVLVIMLTYSIYCNISCTEGYCEDSNCEKIDIIILITSSLTSSGLPEFPPSFLWSIVSIVALLISYYLIYVLTTCEIAYEYFRKHAQEISFVINYNNVLYKENIWGTPNFLREATHNYFAAVWKSRHGHYENRFCHENLPSSFKSEMMIDTGWVAFQHSHLFKKQTLPFLREISKSIKQEYKLPGEFIWKRGEWKNKMVYVVSGTIQLLSEEDGESPVLSLTSGTCLGDSCMVRTYPSRNNVRCKGFCEIYTLSTADFVRLYNTFPGEFSMAKTDIKWRYDQARRINRIVVENKQKMHGTPRNLDIYTLLWTKNTLHKHMSVDTESMRRHRFQNIFLLNETNPKDFKRMLFTAYFLDSLAVAERLEIDTDTVFLKPSCPCILHPDSVIVYFWEFLIISVTIFVAFLIPRKAFLQEMDVSWMSIVMTLCTIIFCFDLYVQFSIGLTSRDGTKSSFQAIIKDKMGTVGFWADLFSCFPLEVLRCIVHTEINTTQSSVMYMNRLIKLWRIENMLRKWEKEFNAKLRLIHVIRFTGIIVYLIYFVHCFLHTLIAGNVAEYEVTFIAVQLVTLTGIKLNQVEPVNLFFLVMNVTFLTIILLMYAHFISADALSNLKEVQVQCYCRNIYKLLKGKTKYSNKVKLYLSTQWQDNMCESVLRETSLAYNLPKSLHSDIFSFATKDRITDLNIFSMLPPDIVHTMCSTIIKHNIYPPNEFLVKSGDIKGTVILVYGGITEILDPNGVAYELDSRPYAINFVEAALRSPSAVTIITATHVNVFYFDITDYEGVLSRYHNLWEGYKTTIDGSYDLKIKCRTICEQERDIGVILRATNKPGKSFFKFSHNIPKDSYAEYDYFIPFDTLYPFHFIRYFLMRTTILPDGKFLFYWECFRCFFAIIACIYFFSFPFINRYRFLTFVLDATCLADIYVRLHVAYYNDNGVLVYHPVQTARYYLTHSFIMDFLGCLPLGYFSSIDAFGYFTLNLPRLLQLYRYIVFMKYLKADPINPANRLQGFMYIPICLVLINLFGTLLVTIECIREIGTLMCLEAIMIASPNTKWFSDVFIHFNGIYVAATAFTNFGMGAFQILWPFNAYFVGLICIIGLYFKTFLIAQLLPMHSFRYQTLISYQEKISSLKFFLNTINTHQVLRKAVIDFYELRWNLTKERDLHNLTKTIVGTLRTDLIYNHYGEELYRKSIFRYKKRSFYRNLIVDAKYECYPQDGYVVTLNDITRYVYILYRGTVDVIAADGTVLARLKPTSFFGNLESSGFARMKISAVAVTTVEILCVEANLFHDLLEHYRRIKDEFENIRANYSTYIPSSEVAVTEVVTKENKETVMVADSKCKRFWLKMYIESKVWRWILFFYCSYFDIMLGLYQFGAMEYSVFAFLLQCTADFLYLAQLLKINVFVVATITKDFVMTIYKGQIKKMVNFNVFKKVITQRGNVRLVLATISLIPLDMIILLSMKNTETKYHLFSLFRVNRMLRLVDLFCFLRNMSEKFNTNVTLMECCYIMAWLSLVLLAMSSFLALITCRTAYSILPLLPQCSEMLMLGAWERFQLYTKYLSLSCDFLTFTAQHAYTPQSIELLVIFIFNKLFCLYLLSVIFSQLYSIVKDCNSRRIDYRDFGKRVNTFLRLEDVSIALIDRSMRYIELLWLRSKGCNYPDFMKEAPLYLQDAILYDAYYQLIGKHSLFVHCHKDCTRQIIQKTNTDIYFNDDYIQFKGSIAPTMYFIYRGSVKVVDETATHDEKIKSLNSGQCFGIIEGLYGKKKHDYTFQADGSAIIISLDLEKWVYLLELFPASKERLYNAASSYVGDEVLQETSNRP